MRIMGSVVGAAIGVIVLRLFVYQPLPFCLCLFLVTFIGVFGFRDLALQLRMADGLGYGKTWFILMAFTQPQKARFTIAVDPRRRCPWIGTVASLLRLAA